ncbi:type I addiction module toxin, SymE family [Pseudomonas aeruginosa]|nr:type I toxin-antitoxin system SymE family toxin [Pseudomonas aeruginosa]MCO1765417.1 type I toxin-antitoxin system SymE family toxin [Pseudomonas aeruginosa]MCO2451882.1 type I toxin-antitoxin system SymE family toxin [Pseudomonas aeruginosa]MCO2581533.1 type I toxin-antitoxin system SymE family toxin [Pseudomonas aeruginosa]MCO2685603.1 type I toxin-antitoxin system SymE family toxin [Pseudomonas aeruginosa]
MYLPFSSRAVKINPSPLCFQKQGRENKSVPFIRCPLYSLAGFEVNEKVRIRVMQGCLVITAE